MKNLYIAIIMFIGCAANAQITEKDLLGEWHIVKVNLDGIEANLETGEVKAADPAIKITTEDIEFVKDMIAGPEGDDFRKGRLIFKAGSRVEVVEKDKTETNSYILVSQGDRQVMEMKIGSSQTVKLFIALKDGELALTSTENGKSIFLKKV